MIDIADRLEPFWDRHLIASQDGVFLKLHRPVPREVTLRFDQPWEGQGCGYPTVLRDGLTYRLYYRGWPNDKGRPASSCLAESRDGIHFERAPVDEHVVEGVSHNNVVHTGAGTHNLAPFIDTHPAALANQRYKALAENELKGDDRALLAFASPDGVHWSLLQQEPVMRRGAFDSHNVAFWSAHEGCYVAYFRIHRGWRTIARAVSDDFLHWSAPQPMSFGETPMEELYTNGTHPYFRAPHVYVSLAKRFVADRVALSREAYEALGVQESQRTGVSEAVFMTSRGGTAYDRTFMEALIPPGPDPHNWSARNRMCTWGVVPTGETEMSFYCQEHYAQPTHRIRRFSLRTDGFASLHAPYRGGEMTTRPLTFTGRRLTMNYATAAAGSVRVEVLDEQGRPAPGLTLEDATVHFGDRIEQTVAWGDRTDLSKLAGRPVRLRFVMRDADVYAIRFR